MSSARPWVFKLVAVVLSTAMALIATSARDGHGFTAVAILQHLPHYASDSRAFELGFFETDSGLQATQSFCSPEWRYASTFSSTMRPSKSATFRSAYCA